MYPMLKPIEKLLHQVPYLLLVVINLCIEQIEQLINEPGEMSLEGIPLRVNEREPFGREVAESILYERNDTILGGDYLSVEPGPELVVFDIVPDAVFRLGDEWPGRFDVRSDVPEPVPCGFGEDGPLVFDVRSDVPEPVISGFGKDGPLVFDVRSDVPEPVISGFGKDGPLTFDITFDIPEP